MPTDGDAGPTSRYDSTDEDTAARSLLADPRLISIMLISGVGVLGSQVPSPALPAIQSGLAVSDTRIGLVMTALFLPTMVLMPVTGAICDIYGRRPVVLVSIAGFGVAGGGISIVSTFETLLALRVVQGACLAALTPMSVAFVGDFFQGTEGTTAQGIRSSTNGIVLILAPAAAGVLADIAWNYPFLLYTTAFPALIVVYVYFPEPEDFEGKNDRLIRREFRGWIRDVAEALNDRNLLLLILGGFTFFAIRYVILTITPLLATRTIGLRPSMVGITLSLLGVVRVGVAPQAGRLASWLPRKTVFLSTMSIVAGSLWLFAMATSLPLFVAAVIIFAAGGSLFNPTLNDTVTASASTENRAGVVSTLQVAKNLANTSGPAAAGVLLAVTDFETVFLVAVAVALAYVGIIAVGLDPQGY